MNQVITLKTKKHQTFGTIDKSQNRGNIDTPNTYIHDRSVSRRKWLYNVMISMFLSYFMIKVHQKCKTRTLQTSMIKKNSLQSSALIKRE